METEIQHLKNNQINKEAWDDCISSDRFGQPYALSWYLDIVSPKWEAFVCKNIRGEYQSVMPLPVRKQFGIAYLQQPLFCQQLGIFGKNSTEKVVLDSFLKKIKENFPYVIDYTFHSGTSQHPEIISDVGMTQYLDLSRPYFQIYQGYNKERKTNLKRAISSGIKIAEGSEIEPLIEIFKNHTSQKIYGGVSESAYTQIRKLFQMFQEKKIAHLFYTYDEKGSYLTGALFVIWNNKIIYLFVSSTPEGKKKNGNTLILDHVIRTYSGQPYILDFESPSEEINWITRFYGSFGSEKIKLPKIHYNELPLFVNWVKKVRGQLKLSFFSSIS